MKNKPPQTVFSIPMPVVFLVAFFQLVGSVTSEVLWGEDGRLIYFGTSTTLLCAWMFLHIHKKAQPPRGNRKAAVQANPTPVKVRVLLPKGHNSGR